MKSVRGPASGSSCSNEIILTIVSKTETKKRLKPQISSEFTFSVFRLDVMLLKRTCFNLGFSLSAQEEQTRHVQLHYLKNTEGRRRFVVLLFLLSTDHIKIPKPTLRT